jgi:hypothetical protein
LPQWKPAEAMTDFSSPAKLASGRKGIGGSEQFRAGKKKALNRRAAKSTNSRS